MKGTGVLQLYAFLTLERQKIPLDHYIIFMAVNDEEIRGTIRQTQERDLRTRKLQPSPGKR